MSTSENLAANLRRTRDRLNLTQAKLAALCGVPRSTLAQIESGSGNPTLGVLVALSGALRLSLEELLGAPTASGKIYKKEARVVLERGTGGKALVHKLLPDPIPGMEMDRLELRAGAHLRGVPHRPGTREYLYCERGALALWSGGEKYALEAGDLLAFDGSEPHSYHADSRGGAVAFSVVALAQPRSG